MNKKTYITPAMEVMNIETVEMMAQSALAISEDAVDTTTGQLGNGRRGSWGNLWGGEE